jgi:ubiquinone/menaquinone biosynthesis C-methylase UbiE
MAHFPLWVRNMIKPRIIEATHIIMDGREARDYDAMMRRFRDLGWLVTGRIIQSGIRSGLALEIGPGPGYLGLEWLAHTRGTRVCGVDISPGMIAFAEKNALEYQMKGRTRYVRGDAEKLPFEDSVFDALFSNYSLHEWSAPALIFKEIRRVLKKGGRFYISDFRRDIDPFSMSFMYQSTLPESMRPGLIESINASYTAEEMRGMLATAKFTACSVEATPLGMEITGEI